VETQTLIDNQIIPGRKIFVLLVAVWRKSKRIFLYDVQCNITQLLFTKC